MSQALATFRRITVYRAGAVRGVRSLRDTGKNASEWLIVAAAIARLFGPRLAPAAMSAWLRSLLFYLVCYVPYLSAPRLDGKPG